MMSPAATLFYTGILCGFYLAIVSMFGISFTFNAFRLRRATTPFMRMCGIAMLCDTLVLALSFYDGFFISGYFLEGFTQCLDGIVMLALLLAGETLRTGHYPSRDKWLLLTIPYVIILLVYVIFARINNQVLFGCSISIFVVSVIFMFCLIYQLYRRDKKLKNNYSNLDSRTTGWYMAFILFFAVELVVWLWTVVIHTQFLLMIVYVVYMLVLWMFLVRCASLQMMANEDECTICIQEEIPDTNETEEQLSARAAAKKERDAVIKANLERLMNEGEVYLNADLDVEALARMLETNRTYISAFIHSELKATFYDYVNGYRLKKAKELLLTSENKVEQVALSCGFNSMRVFLRVFKQHLGCTPTEWRKRQTQTAK